MSECTKIKEKTAAWLNGTLDETSRTLWEKHCAECPSCADILKTARRLKQALRETAAYRHPIPDSVDERIHLALVAAASRRQKAEHPTPFRLFRPAMVALAILLCLVAIGGLLIRWTSSSTIDVEKGTLVSRAEVKAGEPITIEIAYDAARAIQQVEVTIELGEGLSFFSGIPAIVSEKRLRWSGPLSQGRNIIPFVVTVERPGTWRIATTALYEGQRHRHRIVLLADEYKVVVTQYRFPPEALNEAMP